MSGTTISFQGKHNENEMKIVFQFLGRWCNPKCFEYGAVSTGEWLWFADFRVWGTTGETSQAWFTRYRITFRARSLSWTRYKKHSGVWQTILCENNFITSTIFVVFLAYLSSNRLTSFALKHPIIKARFGSVWYRITMFTRKRKWYGL